MYLVRGLCNAVFVKLGIPLLESPLAFLLCPGFLKSLYAFTFGEFLRNWLWNSLMLNLDKNEGWCVLPSELHRPIVIVWERTLYCLLDLRTLNVVKGNCIPALAFTFVINASPNHLLWCSLFSIFRYFSNQRWK